MSKIRILERIFREDGKSVIVAMDHGVTSGPVQGLVDPSIFHIIQASLEGVT